MSPEESLEESSVLLDSLEDPGTGNVFKCLCSCLDSTHFVPSVGRPNALSRRFISVRGSFYTHQSTVDGGSRGRPGVDMAVAGLQVACKWHCNLYLDTAQLVCEYS